MLVEKKKKYRTTQQTKHVLLELNSSQVHCLPTGLQCTVQSDITEEVLYVRRVMVLSSLASSAFFIPEQGLMTSSSVISHLEVCGLLAGGICIKKLKLGERRRNKHWTQTFVSIPAQIEETSIRSSVSSVTPQESITPESMEKKTFSRFNCSSLTGGDLAKQSEALKMMTQHCYIL